MTSKFMGKNIPLTNQGVRIVSRIRHSPGYGRSNTRHELISNNIRVASECGFLA